jgi:hypothetical protein
LAQLGLDLESRSDLPKPQLVVLLLLCRLEYYSFAVSNTLNVILSAPFTLALTLMLQSVSITILPTNADAASFPGILKSFNNSVLPPPGVVYNTVTVAAEVVTFDICAINAIAVYLPGLDGAVYTVVVLVVIFAVAVLNTFNGNAIFNPLT